MVTLFSLLGILFTFDYMTTMQRHKNAKKGYGKQDLKQLFKDGYFD